MVFCVILFNFSFVKKYVSYLSEQKHCMPCNISTHAFSVYSDKYMSLHRKILKSRLFLGRGRLSDSRMQENAMGALRPCATSELNTGIVWDYTGV